MDENVKSIEPLTVQGLIADNDSTIFRCLEISDYLYNMLTNDHCLKDTTQETPNCMINNLDLQNKNLKLLNEILKKISSNLLGGNQNGNR